MKIAQDEQIELGFKRHIKMISWYVGVYHTLHENISFFVVARVDKGSTMQAHWGLSYLPKYLSQSVLS